MIYARSHSRSVADPGTVSSLLSPVQFPVHWTKLYLTETDREQLRERSERESKAVPHSWNCREENALHQLVWNGRKETYGI